MMPVSPTIRRESPTSVATTGAPQAIASATTFGNPSPKIEVESNKIGGRVEIVNVLPMSDRF